MKIKTVVATSAILAALTVGTPAMAQSTSNESGPGSADGNVNVDVAVNDFLDLLSNNLNGDNRDNVTNSGNTSDSGNVRDSGNVFDSGNISDIGNTTDSGNVSDSGNTSGSNFDSTVGSNVLTATQLQSATINNNAEVVSFDGDDSTDYRSGDNAIRGSSFAAFAGINNLTQNTGINNINQSGVNISAQGTVNIGGPN